jgi:hypothetical protein
MQILIPTYDRPSTLTTWDLVKNSRHEKIVIVNDEKQHFQYWKAGVVDPDAIAISYQEKKGINYAREFARSFVDLGEWALMLDDNITKFTAPPVDWYYENDFMPDVPTSQLRPIVNQKWDFDVWFDYIITDSLAEAEKRGANVVAFCPIENPMFRHKKWRDVGYTMSKAILVKNTGISWDQSNGHWAMEEYAFCAAQHYAYGRVLINNFAHPWTKHYTPGGCGPYADRLPYKIAACKDIMERFPNFARLSSKKAGVSEGELRVRFTNLKQVELWRNSFNCEIVRDKVFT